MSSTIKQAIENLKDRIADAYTAVATKGGTLPITQDSTNLPSAIESIPVGSGYTGHVDSVGLTAIGWTSADIAWLESKVDWMEEDDYLYKVPQELIDIYVANGGWDNTLLFAHKDKPYYRWSPRFDTTGIPVDAQHLRHNGAQYCFGILDCYYANTTTFYNMFTGCYNLRFLQPHAGTCGISQCYLLKDYTMNSYKNNMIADASTCYSLKSARFCGNVDASNASNLIDVELDYAYGTCNFSSAVHLSKASILYAINNSKNNTATIKLESGVLAAMQVDSDVQTALANYPNITLAS